MRNSVLLLAYFAAFFTVVAFRDAFLGEDLTVALVTAALLFTGLALWVYIAQGYRPEPPQPSEPQADQ